MYIQTFQQAYCGCRNEIWVHYCQKVNNIHYSVVMMFFMSEQEFCLNRLNLVIVNNDKIINCGINGHI